MLIIISVFGDFDVNMFASAANRKCRRIFSRLERVCGDRFPPAKFP